MRGERSSQPVFLADRLQDAVGEEAPTTTYVVETAGSAGSTQLAPTESPRQLAEGDGAGLQQGTNLLLFGGFLRDEDSEFLADVDHPNLGEEFENGRDRWLGRVGHASDPSRAEDKPRNRHEPRGARLAVPPPLAMRSRAPAIPAQSPPTPAPLGTIAIEQMRVPIPILRASINSPPTCSCGTQGACRAGICPLQIGDTVSTNPQATRQRSRPTSHHRSPWRDSAINAAITRGSARFLDLRFGRTPLPAIYVIPPRHSRILVEPSSRQLTLCQHTTARLEQSAQTRSRTRDSCPDETREPLAA